MTKISVLPATSFPANSDYMAIVVAGVTSKVTVADLATIMNTILHPPGIVQETASATPPTGWLICDGSAISRTTYANLFTAIGTTYGTGDGTTTFNIPDMRQRMPLGKAATGTGNALGLTGGAIDHYHWQTVGSDGGAGYISNAGTSSSGRTKVITDNRSTFAITGSSSNSARYDGTESSNPPYLVLNFIIKT